MEQKFNTRNPAVKRLMREACELSEATEEYFARPLDDNLFEWHFTVRGSPNSDFENGVYHGRILLPAEYPMKPPNIILLTPNGRFEINKRICLSISGHHPESWQPSWSIRTALLAFIAFMTSPPNGAIGSLDYSSEEKQILAKKSQTWECSDCGQVAKLLSTSKSQPATKEENDIINRIALKADDAGGGKKDVEGNREEEDNSQSTNEISQPIAQEMAMINESEATGNDNFRKLVITVIAAIVVLIARRLFIL